MPFGMDPYLEAPSIWPDVRTRLMSIVGEQLTPLLVPKYLAELETQVVIDHIDDDPQVVLPDVSVTSPDVSVGAPSTAAVAAPAPIRVRVPIDGPTRLISVYIRQRETARLVAVIDLLSPVNKRRGKGREEYLEKRRTFLTSPVHFIEIDLLRSYPRMPFDDVCPSTTHCLRPITWLWSAKRENDRAAACGPSACASRCPRFPSLYCPQTRRSPWI
jgi:hypothetical protein